MEVTATRGRQSALSPSDKETFKYEPLYGHGREDHIRVLHLQDNLQLGMTHVDMHATKYRCLSYMWGDPDEGYEICVNDRTVRVRKNLYDFLRTVSQKFQDLPLWIDALCVNQNDMNERGHEVKRMSRIYHNAEEVLMWLGVDGDLKALFDCTKSRLQDVWKGRITGVQRESLLTSIDTFYSHPYWSRTWITQEILEANRVRVLQASHEAFFDRVGDFLEKASLTWSPYSNPPPMLFYQALKHTGQPENHSLFDLLRWRLDSQCSDVRDRIYGLISLVKGTDDMEGFAVDYTEDIFSLFWRTGNYFQAWRNPKDVSLLRFSLDLPLLALSENARQKDALPICLLARGAEAQLSDYRCGLCGKNLRYRREEMQSSFQGRLVCITGADDTHKHALIEDPHSVTLLSYGRIDRRRFTAPYARIFIRLMRVLPVQNQWVEVKSWSTLQEKRLDPQIHDLWHDWPVKIELPAEWILDRLKKKQRTWEFESKWELEREWKGEWKGEWERKKEKKQIAQERPQVQPR